MNKRRSKAVLALSAAAMSLPGMLPKSVMAQSPPEKYTTSYRYTEYKEGAVDASLNSLGEDVERFKINIHQLSVNGPVNSSVGFNIDASTETLSGASPWFIIPDAEDNPVQVMSGATIEESRNELNGSVSFYRGNSQSTIGLSSSTENDYSSIGASMGNTLWFNNNDTTIDFGFSFSTDEIKPTQRAGETRVTKETKSSTSANTGFSQVINKTLLVGANLSYTVRDGFLSDPYKKVYVENLPGGPLQADSRPDSRKQIALDLQLRKYLPSISTAAHLDYRRYSDSWGVQSNTFSLGAYKNLQDDNWQMSGKLRWYGQSTAAFYRNFYINERADGYYSSDYRLSGYSAISANIGVNKKFSDVGVIYLNYEVYDSQEKDDSNPGLVDFDFLTVGFDYSF